MNLDFKKIFESTPGLYLILSPKLQIVAVSNAYLKATMTKREDIIGRNLFEILPDNPGDISASGVSNLKNFLQKVIKNKESDVMPLQKYKIRRPESEGSGFEVRYWSPLNSPILNDANELLYIIHQVEDTTEFVQRKEKEFEQTQLTQELKNSEKIQKKNLKESEDRFKHLVDNVRDYAIFIIDTAGYIMSWNDGAKNIKGYTEEEVIGKHISIFYTEESVQRGEPAYNLKMAKENNRFEVEGWRIRKDGAKFIADIVYSALYDDKGNLQGYSKIIRDITERKKHEDDLKEANADLEEKVNERTKALITSEDRLRMTLDNMIEGIQIIGFDWRYMYVNDSVAKHGKNLKEELLGYTMMEKYPGIDDSLLFKNLQKCMYDREAKHFENKFLFPGGEQGWFELSVQPVPEGIFILSVDITERKNAEKKLKQSIKELKDYKEALDESCIVAVTNQQGIITHVNDNFCEISKYTRDELIGQNHSIINSGYHPKEFIKNLWATITYGKVWRGEIKNKAKDETYYWVDTTIIPFINKQGKPFQYIAIRADITKRKKAEQELNELNEHLELKVIERTAQLETVNKELESFSYSVSHDLRAPLRAVTGYANMLEEDYQTKIDEEGKRLLSIIKYNAEKMGQLIDDLLSFSRLGRKEMQTTNVDMNGLVEGVLIEIDKVTKHQAEIKVNKLHHIKSDYGLMNQVMINLISNAIKYSSKNKTPTIEVKSKLVGNDLVFSVQDNGAGFDMRYVDKLFGVFQRLHTQDEFEGTGVGLAIVQRIISKHGGRVWAEGKVNKGAAFYFSIPQS